MKSKGKYSGRLWGIACTMQLLALVLLVIFSYMNAINMIVSNVQTDTIRRLQALGNQINISHKNATETLDSLAQSSYLKKLVGQLGQTQQRSVTSAKELSQLLNAYQLNYPAFTQLFVATSDMVVGPNLLQSYKSLPAVRNAKNLGIRTDVAVDIMREHMAETGTIRTDFNVLVSSLGDEAFLAALFPDVVLFAGEQTDLLYVVDHKERLIFADATDGEMHAAVTGNIHSYFKNWESKEQAGIWKGIKLHKFSGSYYFPVQYIQIFTGWHYLQFVSLNDIMIALGPPLLVSAIIALFSLLGMMLILWHMRNWVLSPLNELASVAGSTRGIPNSVLGKLQKKRQLQIRIFAFYALTLVPIVLLSSLLYLIYSPYIEREGQKVYQQTVLQKVSAVEKKMDQAVLSAKRLSSDVDFKNLIVRLAGEEQTHVTEGEVLGIIKGAGALRDIKQIRIYDADGRLSYSSTAHEVVERMPRELVERYQNSYEFANISMDAYNADNWTVFFPIRNLDPAKDEPLFSCMGYVEIQLRGGIELSIETDNFDYLFDREHWILAGTPSYTPFREIAEGMAQGRMIETDQPLVGKTVTIDYSLLPKEKITSSYYPSAGEEQLLVSACTVKNTRWTFLNIARLTNVQLQQKQMLMSVLLLSGVLLILFTIVSLIFSLRMMRPIRALERYFSIAAPGNNQIPDALLPGNEFSALAFAFADALNRIEQLTYTVRDREQAELLVRNRKNEAELIALQSQMGSHLISNIFAAMKLLLRTGDTHTLGPMLDASGNFLRHGLVKNRYDVPLEQEIAHAQAYIQLQKVRFAQRLNVVFMQMDKELMATMVPQYVLQPILENAIVHGMPPKKALNIVVSGSIKGDRIELRVENDGLPIDKQECAQLNGALQNVRGGSHIGLANVQERIRLRYGDVYGLKLYSENEKTWVSIVLPAKGRE